MKAESCRWKSIHGCSLYTGSGLVLFFDFFPKSILELMWNQPSTFRVRLPSFAAGLWISRAAGSHHWWLLGGLQILVWQLGSSTLSGELLHLQLPQDTRARPELTETHTPNYSRQIINAWGRGGGAPCGLQGEHLTHCCPLIPPHSSCDPHPPRSAHSYLPKFSLARSLNYLISSVWVCLKFWKIIAIIKCIFMLLFVDWLTFQHKSERGVKKGEIGN